LPEAPSPRVRVRAADASDAGLLADLGRRTFFETFAEDNTAEDMEAYLASAFGPGVQAAELSEAGTTFVIAEVDESPAGYARLIRDGDTPECIPGGDRIEIRRFYVDAAWHRRGVSSALMTACLERAADLGCDTVWLDVWEENPRAIGFYEKWGFATVGRQDFILGSDVQHDLLLARKVPADV
jgi:diamine N-acetyltransferase